jgi:DNA invertase Pin-like site-specific DNA recombinase
MARKKAEAADDGPVKLIAYRRVSTQRQGASGLGLEAQDRAIDEYATRTKGELVGEYLEIETGKKDTLANRPRLTDALSHAKRARAVLVIAKLDRLSRSVLVTAQLHASGVEFVCCDNPHANRMTIQFLAVMAEDESKRTSTRTRDALFEYRAGKRLSKRTLLRYPDGVPPEVVEATAGKLGSHLPQCRHNLSLEGRKKGAAAAGVQARLAADGAYTDVIPKAVAWRAEGLSLRAVAAKLNEAGYRTRHDRPWNHVQVRAILGRSAGKGGA